MEIEVFKVKNIKCGGCVANVKAALSKVAGVREVDVQIEGGQVTVKGDPLDRSRLSETLRALGYPEA